MLFRDIPWLEQPPTQRNLDQSNPLTRGLVAAVAPSLVDAFSGRLATLTGTVDQRANRFGVQRYFPGTGTTARVTTPLSSHASQRTYITLMTRLNAGGANSGRLFDKRVAGAQVELCVVNNGTGRLLYQRTFSGGTGGWGTPLPTVGVPTIHGISYDSSSTGNVPEIYYNGVAQTVATETSPSGTPVDSTDAYCLGNTGAAARDWGGYIGEFFVWDRLLTAKEHRSIAENPWQIYEPRRIWVPVSAVAGNPALTGSSATALTGTPAPSISLGVTGSAVTGAQGTVAPALSLATTGNAATATTGATVASLMVALTGQAAAASVGTVSSDGSASAALTGNAATAAAGVPAASLTVALLGSASTASVGSVGLPSGDITLALSGNSATASAGSVGVGSAGVGGYDEARKRKRFVVKVGDKLVEYGSASAAAKALNKAPEAKPEPVAEVPIRKIKAQARVFKAEQQVQNLFKQQDFEAMLALYEQMQDEDDIETLLMLV